MTPRVFTEGLERWPHPPDILSLPPTRPTPLPTPAQLSEATWEAEVPWAGQWPPASHSRHLLPGLSEPQGGEAIRSAGPRQRMLQAPLLSQVWKDVLVPHDGWSVSAAAPAHPLPPAASSRPGLSGSERAVMFLCWGESDLSIAFSTHPGSQASSRGAFSPGQEQAAGVWET